MKIYENSGINICKGQRILLFKQYDFNFSLKHSSTFIQFSAYLTNVL